jgi:hypothetical protein
MDPENGTQALIGSQPIPWTSVLGSRLAVRMGTAPLVHARAVLTTATYDGAPRFAFSEEPRTQVSARVTLLTAVAASVGLLLLILGMRRM